MMEESWHNLPCLAELLHILTTQILIPEMILMSVFKGDFSFAINNFHSGTCQAAPSLSWQHKISVGRKKKPAKRTLHLGVIRSQNTDSEIGSLVHNLMVDIIKPFPIKLSPVAGKLQIIAVNVFFCVSKKNTVCYRSATYKYLCTSVCS